MMMIRFSDDQAVEGGIRLVVALGQAVVDCERDQGFVDGLDEGLTSWFLDPFLVCIRARICGSHPKAIKTHMLRLELQVGACLSHAQTYQPCTYSPDEALGHSTQLDGLRTWMQPRCNRTLPRCTRQVLRHT